MLSAHVPWLRARNNPNDSCQRIFVVPVMHFFRDAAGGCFTNVSRAPQNILARLWAHVRSFSLKFSSQVLFVQYTNVEIFFWGARETLVKQPPDAFPVLVRKEGVAVDCADLQCFLVDNLCNVGIRVADRLFEWFGRRCYLKRILFRLYGLCVGRCSLCQLVRNSDVKKKWRMF